MLWMCSGPQGGAPKIVPGRGEPRFENELKGEDSGLKRKTTQQSGVMWCLQSASPELAFRSCPAPCHTHHPGRVLGGGEPLALQTRKLRLQRVRSRVSRNAGLPQPTVPTHAQSFWVLEVSLATGSHWNEVPDYSSNRARMNLAYKQLLHRHRTALGHAPRGPSVGPHFPQHYLL